MNTAAKAVLTVAMLLCASPALAHDPGDLSQEWACELLASAHVVSDKCPSHEWRMAIECPRSVTTISHCQSKAECLAIASAAFDRLVDKAHCEINVGLEEARRK